MPHKDPEERRAWRRRHYAANSERIDSENKAWVEKAGYKKPAKTGQYRQLRLQAIAELGGHCIECGNDDPRVLHIDHVNGDGKILDGRNRAGITAGRIRRFPGVYQLLCANCHSIKTFESKDFLPSN
jgi:hypothetical protein